MAIRADRWASNGGEATATYRLQVEVDTKDRAIDLSIQSGTGPDGSRFAVRIECESFQKIAEQMLNAEPGVAEEAFRLALKNSGL